MELRQLESLFAVADSLSYTGAAKRLHVVPIATVASRPTSAPTRALLSLIEKST
ncbi:hypothetical protein ACX9NE_27585 [Mycobacterium sp. ML4]